MRRTCRNACAEGAAARLAKEEVAEAERLPGELGYWPGEAEGIWDLLSRDALVALKYDAVRGAAVLLIQGC